VAVQKFGYNVGSERETYTAVILAPALNILVRIRPKQIAKKTSIWDIGRTHDSADLLHVLQIGRQATVTAEDLLINERSNRQTVETVSEGLPELDRESALALVIEAIDAIDTSALVISAKQEEVLRILDFVRQQQAYCLNRKVRIMKNMQTPTSKLCFPRST
jgi:hypothetical protein